jgi:hypothetical protein
VVGNLFGRGIALSSGGKFERNRPHAYPDLIALDRKNCKDFEIKVALETNKPKGHLPKPGPHLTVHYVLGDSEGRYTRGKKTRGDVVWIWAVRVGELELADFQVSNTPGDSGKTAVLSAAALAKLSPVFVSIEHCPHPVSGKNYREMELLVLTAKAAPKPKPPQ